MQAASKYPTVYHHQHCMITIPKCAICGCSHRAKDHRRPQKEVLSSAQIEKRPESQRPIIMKSSVPPQTVNPFQRLDINNSAY